jgi:small subunit ribosomal protein S18
MSDDTILENEGMQQSGGRRYAARPKICQFCADASVKIDYKSHDLMRRYTTEEGKIRPRRQTGTCARHQREIARAIKRARQIAFIPFTGEQSDSMR